MPWAWCNLSRNPFGELTRDERVDVAVVDVDHIAQSASKEHRAVQLIGGCGRGKTTRMLVLHDQLADSSYTYLPEDTPCPSIPAGRPVLIDEAQRLPRRIRKQIFTTGLPLILATHRNLTRPLRRAGYEVTTFRIGHHNSAEHVCELLNRRIQASRLHSDDPVPTLSIDDATTLVNRFGSNIRAMESYLYDVVQAQTFRQHVVDDESNLREIEHGQMRFID